MPEGDRTEGAARPADGASPPDVSLTIVVPAYNEEDSLPLFLPELLDRCRERGWQAIVVDDGSTDRTSDVLANYEGRKELTVLRHKVNRGYGGALKTGILHAGTTHLVTMDADGQHALDDVERLLDALIQTDADMIVGSRAYGKAPSLYREIGKWLIRGITRLLVQTHVRDLNSGFKLYSTDLVKRHIHLCPDSMAFSDVITLIFVSQRYLVYEHPVAIGRRLGGRSTINTRTAFETVFEILNIIMLFNPMRIFLPASLFCILAGTLWGLPIVLMGRGISVASMLALVTGIMFFFFGLVAQQLSLIRKEKTIAPRRDFVERS